MKKLILVRHAKSSWKYGVIDHERPLNDRGINDVVLISNHLKLSGVNPDLVMSSTAVRAKTTANGFVATLNIEENKMHLNSDLYDFSGSNLLSTVKNCDDKINELMIFGHNYAMTNFANTYGHKHIDNVPTCGVVVLEFNIENWHDLKPGKTLKMLFPKDLKS